MHLVHRFSLSEQQSHDGTGQASLSPPKVITTQNLYIIGNDNDKPDNWQLLNDIEYDRADYMQRGRVLSAEAKQR